MATDREVDILNDFSVISLVYSVREGLGGGDVEGEESMVLP